MQATVDVISVLHAVLQKAQMQHLSLSSCDIVLFQLLVVQMCPQFFLGSVALVNAKLLV